MRVWAEIWICMDMYEWAYSLYPLIRYSKAQDYAETRTPFIKACFMLINTAYVLNAVYICGPENDFFVISEAISFHLLPFLFISLSLIWSSSLFTLVGNMARIAFGRFDDSFSLGSIKAYLAEFISTLLFVFAGVGSAIAYGQSHLTFFQKL